MWAAAIGAIAEVVKEWFTNRREESKAKHEQKLEVIKTTASWEELMANASATSWKDEWFTILLSGPIVAIIWGIGMNDMDIIQRIGVAFTELDKLPDWYQYLLYVAVTASFGIRGADKIMALRGKTSDK
jgi:hypothetical protein